MKEMKIGCGKPTGARVGEQAEAKKESEAAPSKKEEKMAKPMIGAKAPDFMAPAFQNGQFGQVDFSDYLGKWMVICFYPADFTFV